MSEFLPLYSNDFVSPPHDPPYLGVLPLRGGFGPPDNTTQPTASHRTPSFREILLSSAKSRRFGRERRTAHQFGSAFSGTHTEESAQWMPPLIYCIKPPPGKHNGVAVENSPGIAPFAFHAQHGSTKPQQVSEDTGRLCCLHNKHQDECEECQGE